MKKTFLLLLFITTFFLVANAAPRKGTGIVFTTGTWQEILDKAKAEHKFIFMDIYTTWCGPCKMLKNEVFTRKKVGKFYNGHFINASFNGEAGDGVMLATKLGLTAYPSLYIFGPDGNLVRTSVGYMPPKELVRFGKQAIKTN